MNHEFEVPADGKGCEIHGTAIQIPTVSAPEKINLGMDIGFRFSLREQKGGDRPFGKQFLDGVEIRDQDAFRAGAS